MMSRNANTGPGKRGRWLRPSLRGLMVLVVVLSVPLAWKVNGAHSQRRAVEAIERMGGHVLYDYQYYEDNAITGGKPRGTAWLRNWLGDEYFRDVTYVNLTEVKPPADRLRMPGSFPRLETLVLVDCSLKDDEVSRVGDLKQLRKLFLWDIAASDPDLARLKGLTHLRELNLGCGSTKVTDAGLANLGGLRELRRPALNFNENITDRAFETLGRLESLEWLDSEGSGVTSAGAERLRKARPSLTIIVMRIL